MTGPGGNCLSSSIVCGCSWPVKLRLQWPPAYWKGLKFSRSGLQLTNASSLIFCSYITQMQKCVLLLQSVVSALSLCWDESGLDVRVRFAQFLWCECVNFTLWSCSQLCGLQVKREKKRGVRLTEMCRHARTCCFTPHVESHLALIEHKTLYIQKYLPFFLFFVLNMFCFEPVTMNTAFSIMVLNIFRILTLLHLKF